MKNAGLVLSGLLTILSGVSVSVNAAEQYRLGNECLPVSLTAPGFSRLYQNEASNVSLTTNLEVICPVTSYFPNTNHSGTIHVGNSTGRPLTCTRTIYGSSFAVARVDTLTTTVSAALTFPTINYFPIIGIGYRCTLPYKGNSSNSNGSGIGGYMSNHY